MDGATCAKLHASVVIIRMRFPPALTLMSFPFSPKLNLRPPVSRRYGGYDESTFLYIEFANGFALI